MLKKIISLLICLSLVLSSCAFVFAKQTKELNYVSLGSSQTVGFGLPGFFPEKFSDWTGTQAEIDDWEANKWNASTWDSQYAWRPNSAISGYNSFGFNNVLDGSFPTNVKKYYESLGYNVNFNQFAAAGFRADDIYMMIDEDYEFDFYNESNHTEKGYFLEQVTGKTGYEGLSILRAQVTSALKDADLITYDLGSNNFSLELVYLFEDVEFDFSRLLSIEDYLLFSNIRLLFNEEITKLLESYDISVDSMYLINHIVDGAAYCFLGYCTYLDKTMEWIYENNPDATVVVVQIQNFLKDSVMNIYGTDIPIGDILNMVISYANTYAESFSKYCNKYIYARVTDNQRVRFIIDDIANYSGFEDFKPEYQEIYDVCDYTIRIKSFLTPIYEEQGGTVHDELYDETLNAVYDAFTFFIKHIANDDVVYRNSYKNKLAKEELLDIINELISKVSKCVRDGKNYEEAINYIIDRYENLSIEFKGSIAAYMCESFGNSVVLHPSREGYKQMSDAVINTLKKSDIETNKVLSGIKNLVKDQSQSIPSLSGYVEDFISSMIDQNAEEIKDYIKDTALTNAKDVINNIHENAVVVFDSFQKEIDKNKLLLKNDLRKLVK